MKPCHCALLSHAAVKCFNMNIHMCTHCPQCTKVGCTLKGANMVTIFVRTSLPTVGTEKIISTKFVHKFGIYEEWRCLTSTKRRYKTPTNYPQTQHSASHLSPWLHMPMIYRADIVLDTFQFIIKHNSTVFCVSLILWVN